MSSFYYGWSCLLYSSRCCVKKKQEKEKLQWEHRVQKVWVQEWCHIFWGGHLFSSLTLSEPPGSWSNCPSLTSDWSHGPVVDSSASRCRGGDDTQLPLPQGEATPHRGHLCASAFVSESAEGRSARSGLDTGMDFCGAPRLTAKAWLSPL